MNLFAVTVTGVFPPQCVVVWEREESARKLADYLNSAVGPRCVVRNVDSFFPNDMTEPDRAWLDATDHYLKGAHLYGGSDI